MKPIWFLFIALLLPVEANTLYALTKNTIYVQLLNNDLVSLNFSISGDKTPKDIYLLEPPPKDTELFLVNDELYGLKANQSDKHLMALISYDSESDAWKDKQLDLSDLNDKRFFKGSSYLTSPSSDEVYVYGGKSEDEITNRMISINLEDYKVSNISTSTKPQGFYGAANLLGPDPSSQLLIGGESNDGWLNMYQLATWDFHSGWSFQPVDKKNTTVEGGDDNEAQVNSRTNAKVLPIFDKLDSSNISEIDDNYSVTKVLIIGGEMDGDLSEPNLLYLNLESNTWNYEIPATSKDFNAKDYQGFVTVFDNIVAIETQSKKRDDTKYQLKYFDLSLNKVEELTIPKLQHQQTENNKDDGKEAIQQKAILGTVIPVSAIIIMVTAGYFIMKRRKKNLLQQELNDLNNHFDTYFNEKEKYDNYGNHDLLYSDSHSTLDVNSIDSWVRKRQEFDHHKFMNSQETLHNDKPDLPENMTPYSPITTPKPLKTIDKLNKSVVKLKKSISFSNPPSPERRNRTNLLVEDDESAIENYDSLKKLPYTPTDLDDSDQESVLSERFPTLDPAKSQELQPNHPVDNYTRASVDTNQRPETNISCDQVSDYESTNSMSELDVQVLVSSKRRSVLRIMNPDDDTLRKRVPSNEL